VVIFESIVPLIDKEADGRTFRLIGVGMSGLGSPAAADPTDLFAVAPAADGVERA
jgi:DNA polymerase-4